LKRIFQIIKFILAIIIFLIRSSSFAQNKYYYFKLGNNTSKFRNQEAVTKNGLVIGAGSGFEANDFSFANGFINFEVLYTLEKASLENKI